MLSIETSPGRQAWRRVIDLKPCRIQVGDADIAEERDLAPSAQLIQQPAQQAHSSPEVDVSGVDEDHASAEMRWAGCPRKARVSTQAAQALPSATLCAAESSRAHGERR